MIINKTVYPDVGSNTYCTWSNSAVTYDAAQTLEHSIFYAGSVSENVQFCDETNYSYDAAAPNCNFSVKPKAITKADVFFINDDGRFFNFNNSWEFRNDKDYNIVTEFDISQFYFDLNQITCTVHDLSDPDGGHALGSATTMTFDAYRSQTADYKKTHLIRSLSYRYMYGDSTSLCKYKGVASYYDVNVAPMIRYVFNDKTCIYTPVIFNTYGLPTWQGPVNLNSLTASGNFPEQNSDIYSLVYTMYGKWYEGFVSGNAAHMVTAANIGVVDNLTVHAANDQGQQVTNGYHMPDISSIDTDKYMIPVFIWGNRWDKSIAPFFTDEFVMRYFASFGLRFKVDNVMYVGYMQQDGTCNGDYILESELADSDSANRNITDFSGSNYDANVPYVPPSPGDDEDNTDPISTVAAPFGTGLAHYYVSTVDSTVLSQISEAMSTWDIDTSKKDLYRNLISCKIIKPPAGIPASPSTFEIYGVKPQYQGADITINEVTGNPSITFGSYSIPRKFNDFRDYAPYSKAEIYIPYCGWTALPSHVIGKSVSVEYFTDVIAGTVKALVYCNNNVVAEAAGVMAVDIPFAAENVGAKVAAATTGLLSYGQGALQASAGIGQAVVSKGKQGTKNIANGLASVIGAYNQMAMTANENWTEINGKSGDGCCLSGISTIIIKITRPKYGNFQAPYYVPEDYAHTTGFVAMKKTTPAACTGLIICDNVDTSGISGATDRERQLIKEYLESGIIVEHPE